MVQKPNFEDPFAHYSVEKLNDSTKMVAGMAGQIINRGVSDLYLRSPSTL